MFPQDWLGTNDDRDPINDQSQETHLHPTWEPQQQQHQEQQEQKTPSYEQLRRSRAVPSSLSSSRDIHAPSSRPAVHPPSRTVRTDKSNTALADANASVLRKRHKQLFLGSRPTSSSVSAPASASVSGSSLTGSSTAVRVQHSACGACRLRRVKCNLQEEKQACRALFETYRTTYSHRSVVVETGLDDADGFTLVNGESIRFDGERIQCLNCRQRGLKCLSSFHGQNINTKTSVLKPSSPSSSSVSSFNTSTAQVGASSAGNHVIQNHAFVSQAPASLSSSRPSSSTSKLVPATVVDSVTGKTKILRRGKRIVQLQDQFSAIPKTIQSESSPTDLSPSLNLAFDSTSAPAPAIGHPSSSAHSYTTIRHRGSSFEPAADWDANRSPSSTGPRRYRQPEDDPLENLTKEFLRSAFFVQFNVYRPMVHLEKFHRKFLSTDPPRAENLGPVGAIIARAMLAWAYSYGVDRFGNEEPSPTTNDDRLRRRRQCNRVLQCCLKDIDHLGIMRKPSYVGVQVLLLVLPLSEDVASPLERLTMCQAVANQVYSLCSLSASTSKVFGDHDAMKSDDHLDEEFVVKVRIYWYCFVNEAIKTGLKGGRLMLDEEDLYEFQDSVPNGTSLVSTPQSYQLTAQYATAPIRLALACRKIHSALTGPKARRKTDVDMEQIKQAWEALEACSEEFDSLLSGGVMLSNLHREDMERYCDSWKIFIFECHSVIRETLLGRMRKLEDSQDRVVDVSDPQAQSGQAECLRNIRRIHMIAEQKCSTLARTIAKLAKRHLRDQLFAYDANLVRDGIYYAATFLAADGGSADEINTCLAALNEMRWAFSKTSEGTTKIRSIWATMTSQTRKDAYSYAYQRVNSTMDDLQFGPPSTSTTSWPNHWQTPRSASHLMGFSELDQPSVPSMPSMTSPSLPMHGEQTIRPQSRGQHQFDFRSPFQEQYESQHHHQVQSPRSRSESIEKPTLLPGPIPSIAQALGRSFHPKDGTPVGGVWTSESYIDSSLESGPDEGHSSLRSSLHSSRESTVSSAPVNYNQQSSYKNFVEFQDGGPGQQFYIENSQYGVQQPSLHNQLAMNRNPQPIFLFPNQSQRQHSSFNPSAHPSTTYNAPGNLGVRTESGSGLLVQMVHPTPYQPYIPPPFDLPPSSPPSLVGSANQVNHALYASHAPTFISSASYATYPATMADNPINSTGTVVDHQQLRSSYTQSQAQRLEQPHSQLYLEPISPRSRSYPEQQDLY